MKRSKISICARVRAIPTTTPSRQTPRYTRQTCRLTTLFTYGIAPHLPRQLNFTPLRGTTGRLRLPKVFLSPLFVIELGIYTRMTIRFYARRSINPELFALCTTRRIRFSKFLSGIFPLNGVVALTGLRLSPHHPTENSSKLSLEHPRHCGVPFGQPAQIRSLGFAVQGCVFTSLSFP